MNTGGYRLSGEDSAYLHSHATQPVDWRPWSEEAFAEARKLGRPVLLSIGFSACHWCHVMARECFEDAAIARSLNELVIPVKVDRDERPDIDARYQAALAATGAARGWPLTLLLSADGEMIGGGGYFPPVADEHSPGLVEMVRQVADKYAGKQGAPRFQTSLSQQIVSADPAKIQGAATISYDALDQALSETLHLVDWQAGGLLGQPKFPNLPLIEAWLRAGRRSGNNQMTDAAFRSLDAMCKGALFDHLDGGFARYCTDRAWRRPHYEKMLGENAQFVRVLAFAAALRPNDTYIECAQASVGWMTSRLWLEGGGFGASLSAETNGEEGGDRLWTRDEVWTVIGDETEFLERFYTLNIQPAPIYRNHRTPKIGEKQRLDHCLEQLRIAARTRPRPTCDRQMLADRNGHAIRALVEAGALLGESAWLDLAEAAWHAVMSKLGREDDRLWHVRKGEGGVEGLLEDYAALGLAALSLAAARGDDVFLIQARKWGGIIQHDFLRADGAFLRSIGQGWDKNQSVAGPEDDAFPAAAALALEFLARLNAIEDAPADQSQLLRKSYQAHKAAFEFPASQTGLLNAFDTALQDIRISIYQMSARSEAAQSFLAAAWSAGGLGITISCTASNTPVAYAILCQERFCGMPLTHPDELAKAMREREFCRVVAC